MKKQYILFLFIIMLVISGIIGYIGILQPYRTQISRDLQVQIIKEAWDQGDYIKVIELSQIFLYKNPDMADILLLKGFAQFNIVYLNKTQSEVLDTAEVWKSIHAIRKAQAMKISSFLESSAYYVLGKNYYLLSGKYLLQAIEYLELALEMGYESDDAYEFLASALLTSGKINKAIEILVHAIEIKPYLSLYLALMDIYLDQGNYNKANELTLESTSLVQTEPEKIALNIRKARIEIEKDNLNTGIKLLQELITEYPRSVEAHYYLGNIYEKQKDISKARYEWRQAYKMSPNWDKVIAKLDQDIDF